jgi:hypothetical protein
MTKLHIAMHRSLHDHVSLNHGQALYGHAPLSTRPCVVEPWPSSIWPCITCKYVYNHSFSTARAGWARCEPSTPGVYEWEWLDEIVHGMHNVGVTPWITLVFNNPLYPQHCHPQCDNSSDYTSAAAPLPDMTNATVRNAWAAWVHALADRYAGTVNEFEVRLV